jgi:hypothetical protein
MPREAYVGPTTRHRCARHLTRTRCRSLPAQDAIEHSSHILELARHGAQHRYAELKAELATLTRHFPELARRTVKKGHEAIKSAVSGVEHSVGSKPKPRRKMSASARKKIGDAQRKRWAKVKAAKK